MLSFNQGWFSVFGCFVSRSEHDFITFLRWLRRCSLLPLHLPQLQQANRKTKLELEGCNRATFLKEKSNLFTKTKARKDATLVVANLQRQQVYSRLIASDYLEANLDIMDHLISGYKDPGTDLHYGGMLRECIRHQSVARYVLKSENMKKFFDYIQLPNFDVAADATKTFKRIQ
ncbi:putative MO25-like protein [Camellia lanceoleosa]|uniref:MO25-like protein n=1 Tax=Camellia lanceoleosa TaxID=1840588 RepID=A0ACC0IL80_9ERIC|nr:putative MO25-like protein [Camellia lanceoleosa]